MLNEYHIQFLHHLVNHDVVFLIIGGQARRLMDGHHRTSDLDIWARLSKDDIPQLERAIVGTEASAAH